METLTIATRGLLQFGGINTVTLASDGLLHGLVTAPLPPLTSGGGGGGGGGVWWSDWRMKGRPRKKWKLMPNPQVVQQHREDRDDLMVLIPAFLHVMEEEHG